MFWQVISIAATWIPASSTLYTDHRTRRAATAQESAAQASQNASEQTARAQEAIRIAADTFRNGISSRTFEIPSNAFNAGPQFTTVFAATAIVGAALATMAGDQLKKIGMHLEDIRDELGAQTTAMVQGWQTRGFGAFIYEFLKTEIDDHGGEESVGHHAFYVFNPTTSADVVFKQMVRDQPLPTSFGGFSSDLEAIFLLMWSNRQTLRRNLGEEAANNIQFHLLIPAKRTMAIIDRMAIDAGIGKLIIKGHQDEGNCYVWLNFVCLPRQVELRDIRNLNTDGSDIENHKLGTCGVV